MSHRKPAEVRAREGGTRGSGAVSHGRIPEPIVLGSRRRERLEPPDDLSEAARDFWVAAVDELGREGLVQSCDRAALSVLAAQYARVVAAGRAIDAQDVEADADRRRRLERTAELVEMLRARHRTVRAAGVDVAAADVRALERLSEAAESLRALLELSGRVPVVLGSQGQVVASPLLEVERSAAALLLRMAGEFALTPLARTRLGVDLLRGAELVRSLDDDLGLPAR